MDSTACGCFHGVPRLLNFQHIKTYRDDMGGLVMGKAMRLRLYFATTMV